MNAQIDALDMHVGTEETRGSRTRTFLTSPGDPAPTVTGRTVQRCPTPPVPESTPVDLPWTRLASETRAASWQVVVFVLVDLVAFVPVFVGAVIVVVVVSVVISVVLVISVVRSNYLKQPIIALGISWHGVSSNLRMESQDP